jgi:hypothetical protein
MRHLVRTWQDADRLGGLRRFAIAITVFNLLGHTLFGFEQSWAQPIVSLVVAYGLDMLLEAVDARSRGRPVRFAGGLRPFINFLLPAHITGLAVAMLLYANDEILPIAFATALAVASKYLLRAPAAGGTRHFLNPSNFGITATLLLFPWVGIAPPYHFTENLTGIADWLLPGFIVVSGSLINFRFTGRLPLLIAWAGAFAIQAIVRAELFGTPIAAGLVPMTGLAFVLFTFYMVTDPATTPTEPKAQVAFGAAVALVYSFLMAGHVVFGLFYALTIVCAARGVWLYASASSRVTSAKRTVMARALRRQVANS